MRLCLVYWLRREHKRTGRPIDAKYQTGSTMGKSLIDELKKRCEA